MSNCCTRMGLQLGPGAKDSTLRNSWVQHIQFDVYKSEAEHHRKLQLAVGFERHLTSVPSQLAVAQQQPPALRSIGPSAVVLFIYLNSSSQLKLRTTTSE